LPYVKKELDEKKAKGVVINYSSYIEQVKSQLEANLANIEIKNPEIKRHGELTSQKTELAEKIKSIETYLNSTESAFNPDGSINATFIRQYRESKEALENVNEPIKEGKRINLSSENTSALEKLKVELGNVEAQLAEFEISDKLTKNQEQSPKEETLDNLFSSESGNRNIEFYDILYKRYAKEIKQGIEDNFTVINPDGSKIVLTEKERMDSFLTKVAQNPDIPYTVDELNKLISENKVIVDFVEGFQILNLILELYQK
jgi:hypothetical protein